jgi:hypothetical protein
MNEGNRMIKTACWMFGVSLLVCACAGSPSTPYAGQQSRDVKALSADEVDSLLAGKGMGFAKAAELNGFPGPAHVLELAPALHLTDEQRRQTEAIFASMQERAKTAGSALVDEERSLDASFRTKAVTSESLARSLARIGELQAQVRAAHLEAHLAQARILTDGQAARYASLRGYGEGSHHH